MLRFTSYRRAERPLSCGWQRAGFSLTELLVASTIALVVMGAIAQLFSLFSRSLSDSQTTIDLTGRMRTAVWQLRQDLGGVTCDLVPWSRPEADSGYFELIEGPATDKSYAIASGTTTEDLEADTDDVLLFTTRSSGGPFVGRYGADRIESPTAEVAWFCREAGAQPILPTRLYNLHRRQLLVAGYVGSAPFLTSGSNAAPLAMLSQGSQTGQSRPTQLYDLSMRLNPATGMAVPNTLGDLSKRENRCFLTGTGPIRSGTFPYAFPFDVTFHVPAEATFDSTDRVWEDVVLSNVIAFDVRVFDPLAKTQLTGTMSLIPGDPSYNAATAAGASGVYVDLGWGNVLGTRNPVAITGTFPPVGQTAFQSDGVRVTNTPRSLPASSLVATYDTWSLHYEFDGENEDGDTAIDEGTNGVDDNADDLPDNVVEYETSPPYPVPLRGVEVRIRCYEPRSKQVRQITVRHTFVRK